MGNEFFDVRIFDQWQRDLQLHWAFLNLHTSCATTFAAIVISKLAIQQLRLLVVCPIEFIADWIILFTV